MVRKEDACHVTYAKFNHVTWFYGYVRTHASRTDFAKSVTHTLPTPPLHPDDARSTRGPSSGTFANRSITPYASPPFAFASRASVSLRTPKHIFRSFGILSVAVSQNSFSTTESEWAHRFGRVT